MNLGLIAIGDPLLRWGVESVYESIGNGDAAFISNASGFRFNRGACQNFYAPLADCCWPRQCSVIRTRVRSWIDDTRRHILPRRVVSAVEDAISTAYTASASDVFPV